MPSDRPYSAKLPFSEDQKKRFGAFLKATGRNAGPWLKTLAIKAMDDEQSREGLRDLAKVENGGAA